MSLKFFHLFFIVVSILTAGYFGGWCFQQYQATDAIAFLLSGTGAFTVMVGLAVYLGWFIKKSRHISLLGLMLTLGIPEISHACTVCMGNTKSPLIQAANTGVLVLMGSVSTVLVGFAAVFLYWRKRASQVERLSALT